MEEALDLSSDRILNGWMREDGFVARREDRTGNRCIFVSSGLPNGVFEFGGTRRKEFEFSLFRDRVQPGLKGGVIWTLRASCIMYDVMFYWPTVNSHCW